MFKQLILFKHQNNLDEKDLIIGDCNKELFAWINSWPDWDNNGLIIYGPQGSGKTFLSNIWGNKSASAFLTKKNINLLDTIDKPICSVVIDDIDVLFTENYLSEIDFLHFFNSQKAAGYYIVITCTDINFISNIKLPDLSSRLLSYPIIQLEILDRNSLCIILDKKFKERQILVSDQMLKYISSNIPRSFKSVQYIIDWLDNKTLTLRSKINLELIKEGINEIFND